MTAQIAPRSAAGPAPHAAPSGRRSSLWMLTVAVATLVVDVVAVWAVLALFGPVGLLTFAVLALGGLYLVATRPGTGGRC